MSTDDQRARLQAAADAKRIDAASLVNRQAEAARAMLAALQGQLTLTEHYAARLRNVHALMAREMEMDAGRLRVAIAAAEAAGITIGDDGPIDHRSFVPVQP